MQESFKTEDGRVFILSPINTLADLKEIRWFVQFQEYLDLTESPHFASYPQSYVEKVFDRCLETKVTVASINATASTEQGASYLAWLSMKKNHPELSWKEVREFLTFQTCQEVNEKVEFISGFKAVKKNQPLPVETTPENLSTSPPPTSTSPKTSDGPPSNATN